MRPNTASISSAFASGISIASHGHCVSDLGQGPERMVAVDTVIAVKWDFYCFVSRWHKSVLEVRAAASSPRATARPFGQRGLTPPPASNQGPACDRRLDVAQQPIANAGSKGLPVFRTPKHRTNNLRIAATTICLGLSRPRAFNRVTSATIAGLYRIADIAGM